MEKRQPIEVNGVQFNETVDAHGRVLLYSDEDMNEQYGLHCGKNEAYANCPFITIDKDDAQAVINMTKGYAEALACEYDEDVEDLLDSNKNLISLERLIDRVDGLFYPATIAKR